MRYFTPRPVKELVQDELFKYTGPTPLFGHYWQKGELAFLFGDSNSGKTLLANDIAMLNCGGDNKYGLTTCIGEQVVYFDFELNDGQYAMRYFSAPEKIPDGFIRVGFSIEKFDSNLDMFHAAMLQIKETQSWDEAPKIFILDNITFLLQSSSGQKLSIDIMKELKSLKEQFGLSILVIGHCPKRNKSKPITQDALGGSKMLMNFCDSAFAIAESVCSESTRYIKHLKARSVKRLSEVAVVEICEEPYLHFELVDWGQEEDHLGIVRAGRSEITPEQESKILALKGEGKTIREIATQLGLSKSAIGRYLKSQGL